jgi:hypothetical protein
MVHMPQHAYIDGQISLARFPRHPPQHLRVLPALVALSDTDLNCVLETSFPSPLPPGVANASFRRLGIERKKASRGCGPGDTDGHLTTMKDWCSSGFAPLSRLHCASTVGWSG